QRGESLEADRSRHSGVLLLLHGKKTPPHSCSHFPTTSVCLHTLVHTFLNKLTHSLSLSLTHTQRRAVGRLHSMPHSLGSTGCLMRRNLLHLCKVGRKFNGPDVACIKR